MMSAIKASSAMLLMLLAFPLAAADTETLLAGMWPAPSELRDTGRGVAVIFSPDLSVPGNCRFYIALGFACFDDTDWTRVLTGIRDYNRRHPDRRIRTLVLETHGTNGHGLKLQKSYAKNAERSYISVGALQERLEPEGVRYIVLGSCNSGRLLRPEILEKLNPKPGDKLFLPATCGIVDATSRWKSDRSRVEVITPATSNVEMTVVGHISELKASTRKAIRASAVAAKIEPPQQFAISDLMMQMITRDSALSLKLAEPVEKVSKKKSSAKTSERLFRKLVRHLESVAAGQAGSVSVAANGR